MDTVQVCDDGDTSCSPSISQTDLRLDNITDFDRLTYISSSTSTLSYREFCRICRETEKQELYPHCKCKGSVGLSHSSCLLLWIKKSGLVKCELCHERYSTIGKINRKFWQWRLPRVGTKGWFKFLFFIGFLSMLVTFTTWIIWSRVSSSSQAQKERNKRQVEYTYLVYGILVLIAIVGMYLLNFRPFISYVSRCIVINQDITVIPKGELCDEQSIIANDNKDVEKKVVPSKSHCKHSGSPNDTMQVYNKDDSIRYAKLQSDCGDLTLV